MNKTTYHSNPPLVERQAAFTLAAWSLTLLVIGGLTVTWFDRGITTAIALTLNDESTQNQTWMTPVLYLGASVLLGLLTLAIMWTRAIPQARRTFMSTRASVTRREDSGAQPFLALIVTLSPLRDDQIPAVEETIAWLKSQPDADRLDLLGVLRDKNPGKSGPISKTPWQQTLRAVWYNYRGVRLIQFVLSPRAATQYRLFLELAELLIPPGAQLHPAAHYFDNPQNAVDLADYDAVASAIGLACEKATELIGCEARDICVDITSGLKVFSAAATVVTLNSDAAFSYVGTRNEGREGETTVYRARLVS